MGVRRDETQTVLRYLAAGVLGNGLVLVVYYALSLGLEWPPHPAFMTANACILPISFLLSRNWSFRSQVPLGRAFLQFCTGYSASFLLQSTTLYVGLQLSIPHVILVPVGQVIAVVFFYSLQRFVIFTQRIP